MFFAAITPGRVHRRPRRLPRHLGAAWTESRLMPQLLTKRIKSFYFFFFRKKVAFYSAGKYVASQFSIVLRTRMFDSANMK